MVMGSVPVIACDSHAAYVSAIQTVDGSSSIIVGPSMPVKRWVQTQFLDVIPVCYTAAECMAAQANMPEALVGLRQTCPDPTVLQTTFSTPDSLMALFYWWRRFPDRAAQISPDRLTGSVAMVLAWLDAFERQYSPQWVTPRIEGFVNAYILAGSSWDYQRLVQVLGDVGYSVTIIQRRFLDEPTAGCVANGAQYYRCQTIMDEVRLAMQTVVQQAAAGIALSDMMIVVPAIRMYAPIFEQVSAEYQVPVCGLPDPPLQQTLVGQCVYALLRSVQAADPSAAIATVAQSPVCASYNGQPVDRGVLQQAAKLDRYGDLDGAAAGLIQDLQGWVSTIPDSAADVVAGVLRWLSALDIATESAPYYAMAAALQSFLDGYIELPDSGMHARDDLLAYLSAGVVSRETSGVPIVSVLEGTGSAPSVLLVLGCDQDAMPRFETPTYLGRLIDAADCVEQYRSALAYYTACPTSERWFSYAVGKDQLAPSRLFDHAIEWLPPIIHGLNYPDPRVTRPKVPVGPPSVDLVLSATTMNAYAKCPQLYYYRYVLRMPGVSVDRLGVLWGIIVHRVMHVFLAGLSMDERQQLGTDAARLRPALVAAVEGVLSTESWPLHGIRYARHEWLTTGLIDVFLESFEEMGLALFQTEYAFDSVPLASGATVSGSIDCILEDPDTGGLVVVDFKTGSKLPNKVDSVNGKNHQLSVYIRAAQVCFPNRSVIGACFWHIKDGVVKPSIVLAEAGAKARVFQSSSQRMQRLDAAYQANQSSLWQALVHAIRSESYGAPVNIKASVCSQCSYRLTCPETRWQ